jgi:hypothetical protein
LKALAHSRSRRWWQPGNLPSKRFVFEKALARHASEPGRVSVCLSCRAGSFGPRKAMPLCRARMRSGHAKTLGGKVLLLSLELPVEVRAHMSAVIRLPSPFSSQLGIAIASAVLMGATSSPTTLGRRPSLPPRRRWLAAQLSGRILRHPLGDRPELARALSLNEIAFASARLTTTQHALPALYRPDPDFKRLTNRNMATAPPKDWRASL